MSSEVYQKVSDLSKGPEKNQAPESGLPENLIAGFLMKGLSHFGAKALKSVFDEDPPPYCPLVIRLSHAKGPHRLVLGSKRLGSVLCLEVEFRVAISKTLRSFLG